MIVALLSLAGTMVGSAAGILTANRLTNYRILQLESKVERHNSIMERTAILERDVKTAFRMLDDMKGVR